MTGMLEIRAQGDELGRQSAEKIRQKADHFDEKMRRLGSPLIPTGRTIQVRLARPDMKVPNEAGVLYPQGSFEVDPDNQYIARRLKDRSLVQTEAQAQVQAQPPVEAPPEEAPPEAPPEEVPPEEPQPAAE